MVCSELWLLYGWINKAIKFCNLIWTQDILFRGGKALRGAFYSVSLYSLLVAITQWDVDVICSCFLLYVVKLSYSLISSQCVYFPDLEPPAPRPATNARVAQRMIAGALSRQGVSHNLRAKTRTNAEQALIQEAERKQRLHNRQQLRDEAWGDDWKLGFPLICLLYISVNFVHPLWSTALIGRVIMKKVWKTWLTRDPYSGWLDESWALWRLLKSCRFWASSSRDDLQRFLEVIVMLKSMPKGFILQNDTVVIFYLGCLHVLVDLEV